MTKLRKYRKNPEDYKIGAKNRMHVYWSFTSQSSLIRGGNCHHLSHFFKYSDLDSMEYVDFRHIVSWAILLIKTRELF